MPSQCWTHEVLYVQYPKNFKKESFTGKTNKLEGTNQRKKFYSAGLLVQQKTAGPSVYLFTLDSGSTVLQVRAVLMVIPVHLHKTAELPYPFLPSILMPASLPSSLHSNVLCGIFFRIRHSPALKTCSGRDPFSSMIFVMASGNLSATYVDRSCFSCYSWRFKANTSKIIKPYSTGTEFSPALWPSPAFLL